MARIESKAERRRFVRNPVARWAVIGWWCGVALGAAGWLVLAAFFPPAAASVGSLLSGAAVGGLTGGALGFCCAVLYATVRPVIMALFAPAELFEQEYGTPEDRLRSLRRS